MADLIRFTPDLTRATRLAQDVRLAMQGPVRVALAAAHEDMAERVRAYAADELERRKTDRPGRGNLMEKAIRDRRNSEVSSAGFTVGETSWLDRSPAALYYRRIEEGGPNPMSRFGAIGGSFFVPGGPIRASVDDFGVHGRLFWGKPTHGGFTVNPVDAASEGYHVHEAAGRWFLNGSMPVTSYKRAFDSVGINFVQLYRLGYGAVGQNLTRGGGSARL